MKNCWSCGSTLPTGVVYSITSVCGSGAVSVFTLVRKGARIDVGPSAYLSTVSPVHTASSAVSGVPSDHSPGFRWKVHVSPSSDVSQLSAQSPSHSKSGLYWTSSGYSMTNAWYDSELKATKGLMESISPVVPMRRMPPLITSPPSSSSVVPVPVAVLSSSPPPHEAAATTSARSARNHSTRFVISVSLSPSCQAGPLERERPRVRIQRRGDAERDGREVLPVAQGELV